MRSLRARQLDALCHTSDESTNHAGSSSMPFLGSPDMAGLRTTDGAWLGMTGDEDLSTKKREKTGTRQPRAEAKELTPRGYCLPSLFTCFHDAFDSVAEGAGGSGNFNCLPLFLIENHLAQGGSDGELTFGRICLSGVDQNIAELFT